MTPPGSAPSPTPADPASLLALAEDLARRAGDLAQEGRRRGLREVSTKSTRTDMVTEMDRAAEALIVEGLRSARPDDAVIGEEGTADTGTSGVRWLVDPIDGTTNFLYGLPGYNVSIAAADGEGTLVGVVVVPSQDEVFTAVRGGGAFCNGERIRCSTLTDVTTALVATGFNYDPAVRVRQAEVLTHLLGRIRDIRRFGAAAADLCHVAMGRVDAYYEEGLSPWDLAAGDLIAREAGAVTGDYDGGPVRAGRVLAAGPGIFEPLRALLLEAGVGA